MADDKIMRRAWFSDDRKFRYCIFRRFLDVDPKLPLRLCVWMNPSDADETKDDASIRIGMSFARKWGDSGIVVINVMDLVCTDSKALPPEDEAIGPMHDRYVTHVLGRGYGDLRKEVLCGWGDAGAGRSSIRMIQALLRFEYVPCTLALTKRGNPGHPLRKSLESPLVPFVRVPGARAGYVTCMPIRFSPKFRKGLLK